MIREILNPSQNRKTFHSRRRKIRAASLQKRSGSASEVGRYHRSNRFYVRVRLKDVAKGSPRVWDTTSGTITNWVEWRSLGGRKHQESVISGVLRKTYRGLNLLHNTLELTHIGKVSRSSSPSLYGFAFTLLFVSGKVNIQSIGKKTVISNFSSKRKAPFYQLSKKKYSA